MGRLVCLLGLLSATACVPGADSLDFDFTAGTPVLQVPYENPNLGPAHRPVAAPTARSSAHELGHALRSAPVFHQPVPGQTPAQPPPVQPLPAGGCNSSDGGGLLLLLAGFGLLYYARKTTRAGYTAKRRNAPTPTFDEAARVSRPAGISRASRR